MYFLNGFRLIFIEFINKKLILLENVLQLKTLIEFAMDDEESKENLMAVSDLILMISFC